MKVIELIKERYQEWDEFVENSPQGSIYAKTIFLDTIKKGKYVIFVVEQDNDIKNNNIIGGIILFKNIVGIYTNPLLVKHLGIMHSSFTNLNHYKQIKKNQEINSLIITNILSKLNSFIFTFHPNYTNWMSFYWNGYNQTTKYTYQIDFIKQEIKYDEKVKAPIRKAKKSKLIIRNVDVDMFIDAIEATFNIRNTKMPFSRKNLKNFIKIAEEKDILYKMGVYDVESNLHAVSAVLYDKNSSNLILNGSFPKYRKFGGNTLLIDHMIQFSKKNSKIFDFEGSMHERIENFYRGFGASLTPYFIISKNNLLTNLYIFVVNIVKKLYK